MPMRPSLPILLCAALLSTPLPAFASVSAGAGLPFSPRPVDGSGQEEGVSGGQQHPSIILVKRSRADRIRACKSTALDDLLDCQTSCASLAGSKNKSDCRSFCYFTYQTRVSNCNRMQ